MLFPILAIFMVSNHVSAQKPDLPPLSDKMINYINSVGGTWRAARTDRFANAISIVHQLGSLDFLTEKNTVRPSDTSSGLPQTFDARNIWPHCPTIREVQDQGNCASSWAIGAVTVMSDRTCVLSSGKEKVRISASDLLSCCPFCGQGCTGGDAFSAWQYWSQQGIVTGGQYESKEGCQPYPLPKCTASTCAGIPQTPRCRTTCDAGYNIPYYKDKRFGRDYARLPPDISFIQYEIITNGPVEAVFNVYSDFPNYKSGVYQHTAGVKIGAHAVRIIGWGVENGTSYWLAANSWGARWGESGFFKIFRGRNECGIEELVIAGRPR